VKSAATPFQGLMNPRYLPSLRSTHRYYFAPSQEVQVAFKLRAWFKSSFLKPAERAQA